MTDRRMTRDHKAIVDLLESRGDRGATTTDLVEAGFNGYRGRVSELRHDFGYPIPPAKYAGKTPEGRSIHRYYRPAPSFVSGAAKQYLGGSIRQEDTTAPANTDKFGRPTACQKCDRMDILAKFRDRWLCLNCINLVKKGL